MQGYLVFAEIEDILLVEHLLVLCIHHIHYVHRSCITHFYLLVNTDSGFCIYSLYVATIITNLYIHNDYDTVIIGIGCFGLFIPISITLLTYIL